MLTDRIVTDFGMLFVDAGLGHKPIPFLLGRRAGSVVSRPARQSYRRPVNGPLHFNAVGAVFLALGSNLAGAQAKGGI